MALDLSFKDLADAASRAESMGGRPLLVPLTQIDEDRDQPRRVFNEDELSQLAESIRLVGVLQPIVVRSGEASGRYVITMGARRYRAARLAGLEAIPAIIQDTIASDRYAQIIENIQRDDLSAVEIAGFVIAQLEAGEKQAEIAHKLGKPRDWVSRFAAIPNMPAFLHEKLRTSSIRAIYELYQAWRVRPETVEELCSSRESFTDAEARRVAHDLRAPSPPPAGHALAALAPVNESPKAATTLSSQKRRGGAFAGGLREERKSKLAASIVVRHGDRAGCLLIERPADNGTRFATVLIFETQQTEELPVSELQIDEIVQR